MSSTTARTCSTTASGGSGYTAGHAEGVLGRDRRDRGHPVRPTAREGLQVGLDAGATTGVGAGDGQQSWRSGCVQGGRRGADGRARIGRASTSRAWPDVVAQDIAPEASGILHPGQHRPYLGDGQPAGPARPIDARRRIRSPPAPRPPDPRRRAPRAVSSAPSCGAPPPPAGRTPTPYSSSSTSSVRVMTAAPERRRALLPRARSHSAGPGTAATIRPRSSANSVVISDPDPSAASTTTVASHRPAMIRLRAGKLHRNGRWPGGSSDMSTPLTAMRSWSAGVRPRVDDVGPAPEDRDGRAPPLQRTDMRAGVDPERQAAHDGDTRGREAAAQLTRHLDRVRGGLPASDERDRGAAGEHRKCRVRCRPA